MAANWAPHFLANWAPANRKYSLRDDIPKKAAVLLDLVQGGEGRAVPKFFGTFSFNLKFKLFLGCIHDPMTLKLAFLAFKKVVQVVQIWGGER